MHSREKEWQDDPIEKNKEVKPVDDNELEIDWRFNVIQVEQYAESGLDILHNLAKCGSGVWAEST